MTITEFLEARIAEDELAAYDLMGEREGDRVLAECAAKRAIIGLHHPDRELENWYWSQRKCAECGGTWHKWLNNDVPTDIGPEQGCPTVRALAAVYKDHHDYQEAWG